MPSFYSDLSSIFHHIFSSSYLSLQDECYNLHTEQNTRQLNSREQALVTKNAVLLFKQYQKLLLIYCSYTR